ncbi:MAG: hypothetical protein AAGP08_15460 [Pseudomonadota bacterium]
MHTNIVTFPKATKIRNAIANNTFSDNVVSLKDWKNKAKCRRTAFGVFFTSDAACAA